MHSLCAIGSIKQTLPNSRLGQLATALAHPYCQHPNPPASPKQTRSQTTAFHLLTTRRTTWTPLQPDQTEHI